MGKDDRDGVCKMDSVTGKDDVCKKEGVCHGTHRSGRRNADERAHSRTS
jgi:hypothetical protein